MTRPLRYFIVTVLTAWAAQAVAQQYVLDTLAANPNIAFPVAIVFTPDNSGKFFFTEKNNGRVRIYDQTGLRSNPFVTVSVTNSGEQGLLGITLHPDYPDSPYVYIFFTRSGNRDNLVVRYRDSSNVGADPDTIVIVPRNNTATNHNGGNVHFGPDKMLYITFGEYATQSNSQDTSAGNLRGKILRLRPDGSIPSDNPWPGKAFWSFGHRNSFDFTFDALLGKMYSTENGPNCNDEVNRVPRGANMGWPNDFVNCIYTGNPLYTPPLYYFASPLPALTGIAVYRATAFPRLRGKILFTGNSSPTLWTLTLTEDGDTIVPGSFTTLFSYGTGFADVEIGPDGNIYLANGPFSANRILRLRPVAPGFTSTPPMTATEEVEYTYTPTFSGTPPGMQIVSGPADMFVDSTTWTVRWTPTNEEALQGSFNIRLRAENGASTVDQVYTIAVTNVNDPPAPFRLLSPPNDTTLSFIGSDPTIHFAWEFSSDPDLDTLLYTLELDTVNTFDSPALSDTVTGTATSATLTLPRLSRNYYWRAKVSDGQVTLASLDIRRVIVSFVTLVPEPKELPRESELEQNFPNPFNPATNITYTIPLSGSVRLAVFNLLGQEVALIYEGVQTAGMYTFEFKNSELPSGIYFYRIQAPGFVETKKMVIAK